MEKSGPTGGIRLVGRVETASGRRLRRVSGGGQGPCLKEKDKKIVGFITRVKVDGTRKREDYRQYHSTDFRSRSKLWCGGGGGGWGSP